MPSLPRIRIRISKSSSQLTTKLPVNSRNPTTIQRNQPQSPVKINRYEITHKNRLSLPRFDFRPNESKEIGLNSNTSQPRLVKKFGKKVKGENSKIFNKKFSNINSTSTVPQFPKINTEVSNTKQMTINSSIPISNNSKSENYFENEYTRFASCVKSSRISSQFQGASFIRSKRLHHLVHKLKKLHEQYNDLENIEERDYILIVEILKRYIITLDLALTERYIGIAITIVYNMYDATKLMLPLYCNIFYNNDGTHTKLPFTTHDKTTFKKSLSPILQVLNRISQANPFTDDYQLGIETHICKLQLEILLLVVAPIKSMIFRATLEALPATAQSAYNRLLSPEIQQSFKWLNNSKVKRDYLEILTKSGLADELGCKGYISPRKNLVVSDQVSTTDDG